VKYFPDQASIPRAYKSKEYEFLGTLEQYQPMEQHQSINEGETKNQKIKKLKNNKLCLWSSIFIYPFSICCPGVVLRC